MGRLARGAGAARSATQAILPLDTLERIWERTLNSIRWPAGIFAATALSGFTVLFITRSVEDTGKRMEKDSAELKAWMEKDSAELKAQMSELTKAVNKRW
jgi:hypothetical protein